MCDTTAEVEQSEKCLICDVPVSEIHFGINCCRACFVFYKRIKKKKRELRCKQGDEPKGMCRKCRYERFIFILNASVEDGLGEESGVKIERRSSEHSSTPSLENNKPAQCTTSNSSTPTVERMKKAFEDLCVMRKNREMDTYSVEIREQLQQGIIKYAASTYDNVVPHAAIMFAGLLEFFSASFDDFKNLAEDKQQKLLIISFELLHRTDDLYRSVQHFPDDNTLMPSYTTTFSIDRLDEFLSGCPSHVNREEAMELITKNTKRHLLVNKANFKRVQLSREEFLAFFALALWKDEASIFDEDMADIVKRNRAMIMSELHSYYSSRGTLDYSSRLGDLLCLLVSMEELASQHKQDQEMYFLMNMFKEHLKIE